MKLWPEPPPSHSLSPFHAVARLVILERLIIIKRLTKTFVTHQVPRPQFYSILDILLGSQKLFDQKSWDVAALTILCPIKPHPMNSSNFKFYLCLGDEDQNKCVDESIKVEKKKRKSRCYVDVSCFSPAVTHLLYYLADRLIAGTIFAITWISTHAQFPLYYLGKSHATQRKRLDHGKSVW